MSRVLVLVLTLFAAACSNQDAKIVTVDEFIANDMLRREQIVRCRQDPGTLASTPNCRNAEEAEGKSRLQRMNRALGG